MGYQSKTFSLSDEVVAVFDQFKAEGVSPNQLLRRIFDIGKINPNGPIKDDSDIEAMRQRHLEATRDTEFPLLSVRNERETRGLRPKGDTKL